MQYLYLRCLFSNFIAACSNDSWKLLSSQILCRIRFQKSWFCNYIVEGIACSVQNNLLSPERQQSRVWSGWRPRPSGSPSCPSPRGWPRAPAATCGGATCSPRPAPPPAAAPSARGSTSPGQLGARPHLSRQTSRRCHPSPQFSRLPSRRGCNWKMHELVQR